MAPDSTPANEDEIDESRMTLGEHLAELRVRLIRATAALVIAFLAIYAYRDAALEFVMRPYTQAAGEINDKLTEVLLQQYHDDPSLEWSDAFEGVPPQVLAIQPAVTQPQGTRPPEWVPRGVDGFSAKAFLDQYEGEISPQTERRFPLVLQALSAGGPFIAKIKNALLLALFVAAPILFWELWMFIAAGLYKAEKRVVYSFFPVMLALFLAGVAFGFLYLVPNAIYFLQSDGIGVDRISREMEVSLYMQFLRGLSLAMGLVFQLPIAQVILSRTGVVDPKLYARYRGHMAIAALVIAAIVTPPDPFTQILLAGPAIVLWEVGYWISKLVWTPPEIVIPEDELDETGVAV